jgi:guanylate kinase
MSAVFIISAPSGSGKSTLVNEVRQIVPGLNFSISYTTRSPRGSEQNGREYYFVTRPQFEEMLGQDEFLEHASVFGNYYGTARRFLREAEQNGQDLLLDIDVQGAEQIKQKIPQAVSVFILPPDRDTLEKRLRNRSQDREEVIQIRLDTATREIENYSKYDYILVNDRLEESTEALKAILLAERLKRSGAQPLSAESTSTGLSSNGASSQEDAATFAKADAHRLDSMRERLKPILDSFRRRRNGCEA